MIHRRAEEISATRRPEKRRLLRLLNERVSVLYVRIAQSAKCDQSLPLVHPSIKSM